MSDKLTEKEFRSELERILDKEYGIDVLVIGPPSNDLKWYVSLRIAEMIREYYKRKQNEDIDIVYSYSIQDQIKKSTKMNIHDVHILRLIPTSVGGIYAFLNSKRQENKHFIYVSHDSENLRSENKKLKQLMIFYFEILGTSDSFIKCIAPKTQKEIEFSMSKKELIDNFHQFKVEIIKKLFKGSE